MQGTHFEKKWVTQFRQEIVMEWYEAYINFIPLSEGIKRIVKIYDRNHEEVFTQNHEKLIYNHLPEGSRDNRLMSLSYDFCHRLNFFGLMKSRAFLEYKKYELAQECLELEKILDDMSMVQIITHHDCIKRHNIKTIIKLMYITAHDLKQFIRINEIIYGAVNEVTDRFGMPYVTEAKSQDFSIFVRRKDSFLQIVEESKPSPEKNLTSIEVSIAELPQGQLEEQPTKALSGDLSEMYLSGLMIQNRRSLEEEQENFRSSIQGNISSSHIADPTWSNEEQSKFISHIEDKMKILYSKLVFFDERKTNRLESLINLNCKKTSSKTYTLVGLYCGMSLVSFLAIFMLLSFGLVKIDNDRSSVDSIRYIFPLFRGVGLFILYMWGMAWNVYGFNYFRVSYQRILQYGSHYSTYPIIIKRAAFFTLVYFVMLLLYFIGATHNNKHRDRVPVEYTPFVVWIMYLGYIFFPNREVFNPRGRRYFYRVLKEVIMSPCGRMSFLISWVTDQSVSFVIPIKDMGYSICFYTADFSKGNPSKVQNSCLNDHALENFIFTYMIALLPLLFRMAQCYRQAKQSPAKKFIGHIQMWNFGKYMTSVLTATLSFGTRFNEHILWYYIVSSIISTCYAYYWDLKYDWGFLEKSTKHKFLRNHLSYNNARFYYLAIFINLLMRLSWTLSISPWVVNHVQSPLIPLLIGTIEILRRCMWNFFRIEKEHIVNCRNFLVAGDISTELKKLRQQVQQVNERPEEGLPYFIQSKGSKIHQVDIIPPESASKVRETDVSVLKELFTVLLKKQKQLIAEYDAARKKSLSQKPTSGQDQQQ